MVYKRNICFKNRLLLCSCFIHCQLSARHLQNVLIIVDVDSLGRGAGGESETSETSQTGCRNAATFVWLPRHYHKGLQIQVHLFHESGCSCLLAVIKCSSVASFLWPEKAKTFLVQISIKISTRSVSGNNYQLRNNNV